jgi:endonuclease/exonuclease/phosphatase family metal-dependent hydrolase
MLVMLLWWIPTAPDSDEVEQVGPSVSIGLFVFVAIVYTYSLTFEDVFALRFLQNQALTIVLVAGALAGIPRLFWREVDPWAEEITIPRSLPAAFVAPVVLCGLLLGSITARDAQELGNTFRIATYNINNGYDENGVFQLDATARTIEASVADVVLIQQVDTGRPTSYGIDELEYLARRLGMYHAYLSSSQHLEGVGILSRWQITDLHGITLSDEGAMSAVRVRISDIESNRTLDIVSADFRPAQNDARLQQLAYFFNLLDPEIPTVAGLSLGSGPEDIAYQQLTSVSFDDPDKTLGIERGYTYPATNPTERTDYLLIRGLVASETRQVKSEASNHRLVVVELHWP